MVHHEGDGGTLKTSLPHLQTPGVSRTPGSPTLHVSAAWPCGTRRPTALASWRLCVEARARLTTVLHVGRTVSPPSAMSQTHSHGPGQAPHSHGPSPPQQMPQGGMPQQPKMMMPQPDPLMQAVIEASFVPVDITFGPPDNVAALCEKHSLERCADCDVDFLSLNRLSRLLQMNPALRCPPPPQMLSQKLSAAVNNTKEEGNVRISVTIQCVPPLTTWHERCFSRQTNTTKLFNATQWQPTLQRNVRHGKRLR